MKKVLSVLLAVCLFATLLVPAFAWGQAQDVAKAAFDKESYNLEDILNDDGKVNIGEMLTMWDANGNRTNFDPSTGLSYADIRAFNSSNNEVLTLTGDGYVTKIKNNKASTVTVSLRVTLASGVQATTKIVVPANVDSEASGTAYGYRLANAVVKKGAGVTVDAGSAVISYKAKAASTAGDLLFYSETNATNATVINTTKVTVAATDTAQDVADKIRTAGAGVLATLWVNGVKYDMDTTSTGTTVEWKSAAGELVEDFKEPSAAQKAVSFTATANPAFAITTDGEAAVSAIVTLTTQPASGAKAIKIGDVTIPVDPNADASDVAATVTAYLTGKEISLTDTNAGGANTVVFNDFENPITATNTVVFTAKAVGVFDTGIATPVVMVYDSVGETAWTNGSNSSTPDKLIYNIGDEITPILSSYSFTGRQKESFEFAVRAATSSNSKFTPVTVGGFSKYGLHFALGTDADGYPQLEVYEDDSAEFEKNIGTYVYVRVLNKEFANAQSEKEFSIKLAPADSTTVTKKILPAEKTIGKNQTLDLRTLSKSVADTNKYWTVEPYGDYQTVTEAGMIAKIIVDTNDGNTSYGATVKGLAPGVVTIKVYDTFKDYTKGNAADSMKLNVGTGTPATPEISAASAAVKVNEQVKLTVKNVGPDQYVKWSIDSNNISLANFDGVTATVYGKKEGTAVVTARVYESNAKDAPLDKEFKINVTVKAAESKPVTTPTTTAPTANPQTGDSIFANLF